MADVILTRDAMNGAADTTVDSAPDSLDSAKETPEPQDIITTLRHTTDHVLQFLSTASNETLGACVVGLGATTYIVLGRVGLLLIGAVGGVVLHATWEGKGITESGEGEEQRRRWEVGIDVARRVLDWRQNRSRQVLEDDSEETATSTDFSAFTPQIAKALNTLTDAVIRDYVRWWYSPVLPTEERFPAVSRATFSSFLLSLSNNIASKRPADCFTEFVTNSSSIVIVLFNELSAALYASSSSPPEDAINTYLESKPESNLASIVDKKQQSRKLYAVADDILETYLDQRVYSCPPAQVFLREVLANLVLDMTLDRCSQADWINEWIVYLLEEGEPELLTAIDAGLEKSAASNELCSSSVSVDGNGANTGGAPKVVDHQRRKSKAEDAMEEAMREAQRLTALMAEEDARREKEEETQPVGSDDASDSTNTQGIKPPASSQGDLQVDTTFAEPQKPEAARQHTPDAVAAPDNAAIAFSDFDHLASPNIPTALMDDASGTPIQRRDALTLHKGHISIFDDADPNDKRVCRSKPPGEYMIQIEPASHSFPGWMIPRTYADMETLHEVLRRISAISGVMDFANTHPNLPTWKGHTKTQLTQELERYLIDALQYEQLAESEGMKRFLEKERGMTKSPRAKAAGFWAGPAAIENLGKGAFDVLTKAPKNVAGGGKAVLGGVSSLFGVAGAQVGRSATSPAPSASRDGSTPRLNRPSSLYGEGQASPTTHHGGTVSIDSGRTPPASSSSRSQSRASSTFTRSQTSFEADHGTDTTTSATSTEPDSSLQGTPSTPQKPPMNLPPPPSDMPDDYMSSSKARGSIQVEQKSEHDESDALHKSSRSSQPQRQRRETAPMSEKETQVTVELMFAVLNELYGMSSAWVLRRTLLNAARSYLLRPGNPQLESIRVLLQESVLDANASDAGIAGHILKIRENSLPTEEELAKWPKPRTETESEQLRIKARRLLVEKGMPQALTSVMGQAASGEALGKLFDYLQIQKVAKGLMFGLMLQAIRALTQ